MDFIADILPFIVPILTFVGGLFLERRMREANAAKVEAEAVAKRAEAEKILAEAEKVLAEADNEEAHGLGEIITAWRALYETSQERMTAIEVEQTKTRTEYEKVRAELKWYRHGVSVLIRQMERLNIAPEWTPDMPHNGE